MTSAKALGCGVPVGAFVLGEKAAKASLEPGDHAVSYTHLAFILNIPMKFIEHHLFGKALKQEKKTVQKLARPVLSLIHILIRRVRRHGERWGFSVWRWSVRRCL